MRNQLNVYWAPFLVIFGAVWAGADGHKHGRMYSGTAVFGDQGWFCVLCMKEFSASPLTVYRRPGICLFFSHSWPEESLASCAYRLEHGSQYNVQLAWNHHLELAKAPTHFHFLLLIWTPLGPRHCLYIQLIIYKPNGVKSSKWAFRLRVPAN